MGDLTFCVKVTSAEFYYFHASFGDLNQLSGSEGHGSSKGKLIEECQLYFLGKFLSDQQVQTLYGSYINEHYHAYMK